jgi:hypothetical protein
MLPFVTFAYVVAVRFAVGGCVSSVCGVVFDFFALMFKLFFVVGFVGCVGFCGLVLGVGGIVMIFCVGCWRRRWAARVGVG